MGKDYAARHLVSSGLPLRNPLDATIQTLPPEYERVLKTPRGRKTGCSEK